MIPISDDNAFFSVYISKKEPAVSLSVSRRIEAEMYEESTKCRIALGDIERAHRELDFIGVPRNQKNTPQFPLSLAGRIRAMKIANQPCSGQETPVVVNHPPVCAKCMKCHWPNVSCR